MLNHIQHTLHKLESQGSNQIIPFTDGDDNDDSDDEDPNLEDEIDSPSSQVASAVALDRSRFEEKALTSFLAGFDFQDYSSDLVMELSTYLLDFLISSIQKEVIGQFDHELITFHAAYAMELEAKSFKSPGLISQAYSAIIYIFQLIVVEASSLGKGMSFYILYYIIFYILYIMLTQTSAWEFGRGYSLCQYCLIYEHLFP
jgi:hypothetical protein